jgi:Zn finger protein HypA/HybF involved in hydrogenase expression
MISLELYLFSKKIVDRYEAKTIIKKNHIKLNCKHHWEYNPDDDRQMVCRNCYSIILNANFNS